MFVEFQRSVVVLASYVSEGLAYLVATAVFGEYLDAHDYVCQCKGCRVICSLESDLGLPSSLIETSRNCDISACYLISRLLNFISGVIRSELAFYYICALSSD